MLMVIEPKPIFLFLKENAAISFSLLSGYGYLCAYLYFTGFADFYGLPVSVIPIQLTDIIKFALNLLSFLSLLSITIALFPTRSGGKRLIRWIAFTIATIVFFKILRQLMPLNQKATVQAELSIITIAAIFPSFQKPINKEADISNRDLFLVSKRTTLISFIVLSFISVFICNKLGYGNAANKAIYLVPTNSRSLLVVYNYDDKFICVNYDSTSKKIGDTISIIKNDDATKCRFVAKKIGPLKSNRLSDR